MSRETTVSWDINHHPQRLSALCLCLQWEDSPAQWRGPTQSPSILPKNLRTPYNLSVAVLTMRMRRNIKSLLTKWSQQGGRQGTWATTMKRRRPSQSEARLSVHKRWSLSWATRGATRSPLCLNSSYVNWREVRFLFPCLLNFYFVVNVWTLLICFVCSFADFYQSTLSQLHPAEMQEQLLSCLSSDPYTNWEPWDKKVTQTVTSLL